MSSELLCSIVSNEIRKMNKHARLDIYTYSNTVLYIVVVDVTHWHVARFTTRLRRKIGKHIVGYAKNEFTYKIVFFWKRITTRMVTPHRLHYSKASELI